MPAPTHLNDNVNVQHNCDCGGEDENEENDGINHSSTNDSTTELDEEDMEFFSDTETDGEVYNDEDIAMFQVLFVKSQYYYAFMMHWALLISYSVYWQTILHASIECPM